MEKTKQHNKINPVFSVRRLERWRLYVPAAGFLSQFAEGAKWAHLDIAGVGVWGAGEKNAPGSIGFGVRLLTAFVTDEVRRTESKGTQR